MPWMKCYSITFNPCVYLWILCVFHRVIWIEFTTGWPFQVGYAFFKLNNYMMEIIFYNDRTYLGISHGHQYVCYTICDLYTLVLIAEDLGLGNFYYWSYSISACHCGPPTPILKGTPKKGCHGHSETADFFRMDHFEFLNWIWETFSWVIRRATYTYIKVTTVL